MCLPKTCGRGMLRDGQQLFHRESDLCPVGRGLLVLLRYLIVICCQKKDGQMGGGVDLRRPLKWYGANLARSRNRLPIATKTVPPSRRVHGFRIRASVSPPLSLLFAEPVRVQSSPAVLCHVGWIAPAARDESALPQLLCPRSTKDRTPSIARFPRRRERKKGSSRERGAGLCGAWSYSGTVAK